ncbi:hypothetical protein [Kribbella sp.]|uniref:hypothetical protein n=1 Tax=Kribbella sp. TaxID=1871183 RepID=UPI002D2E10B9|nr:hypothetical protein [Kribbella sp.]HZX04419.1 hypothetical protein [Kribbella sp.]
MEPKALQFRGAGTGNVACAIDLELLYATPREREAFEARWLEFLASDPGHGEVLTREGAIIRYPHKSWLPTAENGKPAVLFLFGNPAPHSVIADVYFAYEGNGAEHRFWKVLRELGFVDLFGDDENIKQRFLQLNYTSPFRLGFDVIYTFPSSASKPKWSGVLGVERLFGRAAIEILRGLEQQRLQKVMRDFLASGGAVIAMQKDAYNAIAQNAYDIKQAVAGTLMSEFDGLPVYGTPPTRWLYTSKMKDVLRRIKVDAASNTTAQKG